ncbi:MAG: deoxynucleoside kinase [Bacteroidales bacterium]|nr:deoxynucleoside kinase [Bacteroidales bacterium]
MHIAVAGNIGSGKTTLTRILSEHYGWEPKYEDARIFATNLHAMGLLSTRDYENYKSLFELMISLVKPPDLLIYLKSSIPTLVYQINKRGREYESAIRTDYLEGLNERYDEWFASYNDGKKLVINVDELKFEDNPQDLQKVIELINKECGL